MINSSDDVTGDGQGVGSRHRPPLIATPHPDPTLALPGDGDGGMVARGKPPPDPLPMRGERARGSSGEASPPPDPQPAPMRPSRQAQGDEAGEEAPPPGSDVQGEGEGRGEPTPSQHFPDLEAPKHLDIAKWWREHGMNISATARKFGFTRLTITRWRDKEKWLDYFNQRALEALRIEGQDESERLAAAREDTIKAMQTVGAKLREYVKKMDLKGLKPNELSSLLKILSQSTGIMETEVKTINKIEVQVQRSEEAAGFPIGES